MSEYKYKGQLSTLADMYLNTGDHEPLLEIERVYTQAAKADEYEEYKEKAEDYDRFIEDIKKYYSGVPLDASLHDLVARHYFNKEE